MGEEYLDGGGVFNIFLFVFFNGHKEGQFFGEEVLLNKEASLRQRLSEVGILDQFIHDILLE